MPITINDLAHMKEKRIVLLVGAGIHQDGAFRGFCEDSSQHLGSWSGLVRGGFDPKALGNTLAWELNALEHECQQEQAAARIQAARKNLAEEIRRHGQKLAAHSWCPRAEFKQLLSSGMVTDVVSLNVDLVLEGWLARVLNIPLPRAKNKIDEDRAFQKSRRMQYGPNASRRRFFQSSFEGISEGITFWYPHGDIEKPSSLQFSLSDYGKSLVWMEKARSRFKKNEAISDSEPTFKTWLDPLMSRRKLLLIGTSLDRAEWDIWLALLFRWRNFSRFRNEIWYPDTAILTTKNNHQYRHIPHDPKLLTRIEEDEDWNNSWSLISRWSEIFI
jgi:hypothetical protein